MNYSPLVKMVSDRLVDVGYHQFETPFRIASVEFNFTLAFRGDAGRANDLVLIVDTTTGEHGDRDSRRVSQRIAGLGRALDVSQSRFVITVILVGAVSANMIEDLSENCRVLTVDRIPAQPGDEASRSEAERLLNDRIGVLLPLTLPEITGVDGAAVYSAIEELRASVPKGIDAVFVNQIIESWEAGKEAVEESLFEALDRSLEKEGNNV